MDRRLFAFPFVLLLAASAVAGYFMFATPRHVEEVRYPVSQHSPISIGSDSGFTKPGAGSGCECVRSGSGRELDPYLISDWVVNSTDRDSIVMAETTAHFVIARVVLKGTKSSSGIYMTDVKNGTVRDCVATGRFFGAYVFHSSNLEFINNTFIQNQYGIQLEASDNNTLVANRFDENMELGIFLRGSNNILKGNSATQNGFGGINVDGTAGSGDLNQLEGNVVSDNAVFGIGIWRGAKNVLKSNTITHNSIVGVMLTDHSASNLVEANTVSHNEGSGIVLTDGSSGNTIRGNTARGNGDGAKDFDLYDNGSGNVWQDNKYDTRKPDTIN